MEFEILKEYIEKYLINKFIHFFISLFDISILFIKKSHDHGLYLIIDYYILNCLIIKNYYLLFLISEILNYLKWIIHFTKIDFYIIYNLFRIILDEEWKIIFQIYYNHFKYLIISFELINIFIIFQLYINSIFKNI